MHQIIGFSRKLVLLTIFLRSMENPFQSPSKITLMHNCKKLRSLISPFSQKKKKKGGGFPQRENFCQWKKAVSLSYLFLYIFLILLRSSCTYESHRICSFASISNRNLGCPVNFRIQIRNSKFIYWNF